MEDLSTLPPETHLSEKPKSQRNLLFWIGVSLVSFSFALSILCAWWLHRLSSRLDDLTFQQVQTGYNQDNDLLSPNVGVIQFMHRGYSITFDTLTYTTSGLEVSGTIGNPTQMTLSSLNIKLSARPYLYKNRDKVIKDWFFVYSDAGEIGSGQTSISYLGPGKTAVFSMTIPNVKQTSDGFQIAVSFSGERYSYY